MSTVTFTKKHLEKLPEIADRLRNSDYDAVNARSEESVAGEADLRDDEPMPAWKVELVAKIQAVEAELQECDGDVSECKDALSEAKERHAGKVSDLRSLIRKLDKAEEQMPLLDSLDKPATNGKTDGWRKTCIDDLQAYRLSPSIVAKLREKSLETLGDLADFQAKHGEFWPQEIKGLGPAKAAQVTDAQAAYWQAYWQSHPEYCGAAT